MNDETLNKRVDQLERVNRELLVQISAMRLLLAASAMCSMQARKTRLLSP